MEYGNPFSFIITFATLSAENDALYEKSLLHSTGASRPERTNMRSLLACLADVTRIYGDSQKSIHIKRTPGKCQVKQKPVDALRPFAVEVAAIGHTLACCLSKPRSSLEYG